MLALLGVCWVAMVLVPELGPVRNLLVKPLVVHEPEARGQAAYVLGGGNAFRERLDAAADLIHMERVDEIFMLINPIRGRYHFPSQRGRAVAEWDVDYLRWLEVPLDKVKLVEGNPGARLSTLDEARQMARLLAERPDITDLVVISSPAHMRRVTMAFEHALPGVRIHPFAARRFIHSAEADRPLWREYVKLAVYWLVMAFD